MVYGQSRTYIDAVLHAGGAPVILPIVNDISTLQRLYEQCDGLLLSGGNDVDPSLYGEERKDYTEKPAEARDAQELQLIRWAREDDKPLLAICRGAQLLNVALGGTLYQDVAHEVAGAHDHTASVRQKDFAYIAHERLLLKPGSRLAGILDVGEIKTNALHHQSIKTLGNGLRLAAWTEDDVIEAVELPEAKFVIGVQSHPEALENEAEPRWRKLFEAFTAACS